MIVFNRVCYMCMALDCNNKPALSRKSRVNSLETRPKLNQRIFYILSRSIILFLWPMFLYGKSINITGNNGLNSIFCC